MCTVTTFNPSVQRKMGKKKYPGTRGGRWQLSQRSAGDPAEINHQISARNSDKSDINIYIRFFRAVCGVDRDQ